MAVFISKFGFNVVAMIGIGDCSTKGLSIDDEVMLAVVIIVVDVAVVLLVVDGIMGDGGSENILNKITDKRLLFYLVYSFIIFVFNL